MSTVDVEVPQQVVIPPLRIDQARGKQGVMLFIATEAALFVILFFTYFFLSGGDWRWLSEEPPKLTKAIIMLVVLVSSSIVLGWGEKQVEGDRFARGRIALGITILLGLVFLALSAFDYKEHLEHVTPQSDAYGSIFYTITSFHVAHLILGLLMLGYVELLRRVGRTDRPPHRAYSDAASYWHFVDTVWVFIVGLLYILPNIR